MRHLPEQTDKQFVKAVRIHEASYGTIESFTIQYNTIQYNNTILPTGLKPASALASEPCSAHEGCGRDCPQFFSFVDWAIETTRTSPSIPVAF
jgi:hypothetical protein